MDKIIIPIISEGWRPDGYSYPVINLQLINAVKIMYDEPYKCHPHYQLHLQYQSVKHTMRTPLCKITSTGEIEQRFRLN